MRHLRRLWQDPRSRNGLLLATAGVTALIAVEIPGRHYIVAGSDFIPLLVLGFLLGRAVTVTPGSARSDEVGMLAYLPLPVAALVFMLVPWLLPDAGKQPQHALDGFYTAAAGVLVAVLIMLMIESRGLLDLDPQLRALRAWWAGLVMVGVLAALVGLTPGLASLGRQTTYRLIWASLAGAIAAGSLVMARDWLGRLAERTRYVPPSPGGTASPGAEGGLTDVDP